MKNNLQGEEMTSYHNLSRVSVIRRCQRPRNLNNLSFCVFGTLLPSILSCAEFWSEYATFLAEIMQRTLAPLRRIVARQLEVLAYARGSETPQSFLIHDRLECGHEQTCLGWDIFDLLNAYTDNPEVSAKRHRCRPCASLLAEKKPVQSVTAIAAKGVA